MRFLAFEAVEHHLQTLRHRLELTVEGVSDLLTFLLDGEVVITRDHLIEPVGILAADVAQVGGQLEGQRVAVALGRFKAFVVQFPIAFQDGGEGDAVVRRRVSFPS